MFIELVRENPPIYDKQHGLYKDRIGVPAGLCGALEACRLSAFVQLSWLSVGCGRLLGTFARSAF